LADPLFPPKQETGEEAGMEAARTEGCEMERAEVSEQLLASVTVMD